MPVVQVKDSEDGLPAMHDPLADLTNEQQQELLLLACERIEQDAGKSQFSEVLLLFLEDVSGFELMSKSRARRVVNHFWSMYVSKAKNAEAASSTASPKEKIKPDLEKQVVKDAIAAGKKAIGEGGTKADAARAMYVMISSETKETIVAAFVEGATLTEKGALTYWYNCKRKAKKSASGQE